MAEGKCPICAGIAGIASLLPNQDAVRICCERCGHFYVSTSNRRFFEGLSDRNLLPFLSAHIRQNSGPSAPLVLRYEDWESHALAHKATPVSRKLDLTLRLMAQRSAFPGADVVFPYNDGPLIDAANEAEIGFLMNHLKESEFLDRRSSDDPPRKRYICVVSGKGWTRSEAQSTTGIPGRCFVAMSFDHSLDEAWEKGIEPALREDCKLDPIRIDKGHHNEKICDKLIAEIRLSQFLVADFTLHRAGVYFEAGFALGLGRPVIWTCRKDDLGNTHFDTRQYNHIDWESPEDLRSRLRDRVIATIPMLGS